MTLKSIFQKPVDRHIEGVIKADDEASLKLEIEEYVLTNEVEKRLEQFLDAYCNYVGANGVWVSGFFGSGKSHLLKILALLMENRLIDGNPALDLFLPKCRDNEILRGDLKRAVSIPSKSILFNIDQKADIISKTQIDALLAVFVKVFDEMCGYYGKQGYIAQFERDLDSRGLFDKFKTTYKDIAGIDWQKGREQALLETQNIAKTYANVTNNPVETVIGILDKYRSEYKVSIEDFAEMVKAFIERQAPGFRLNFFVDEVGQYIADNVKLMTNLQTIAESLATKCSGRAWVVVTAQEDMNNIIGEMSKQQGNDFSKIQDRFANRMKLTGADVAVVIQKRLLEKNDSGINILSDIYHLQVNNFKTLLGFADGAQTYRNFLDRDHFIHCYPFIPYQFDLFQSAISNLSLHNVFEGKHSSVGERSMLAVFQQVAIQIGAHKIGQLATFDLMFEGIRSALKSNIQRSILNAEKNVENKFAVRLLKTLFLVKYIKEFKPTKRNLSVLMLDAFDSDLPELHNKVEEALNLLEQENYIQRNGDYYEFMTDEEKDVEQEIKNTEVESIEVANELEKIIFDYIIKNRKIRFIDNSQDYPFSRKLDDRLHGREHELSINIITPFHENVENKEILKIQNMGRDELLVVMPSDERLIRDIYMYKRTEKYIRQNTTIAQQEIVKRILTDKGFSNSERYKELQQHIQILLGRAKLFAAGREIEVNGEDPQSRIIKGFHELIYYVYPNLTILRGITYNENNIAACLARSDDGFLGNDAVPMEESEQELLAFIQNKSRGGLRTTLKIFVENFERKPYGWPYPSILCILASLLARGKVDVRVDGNILEEDEFESALRNSHGHANVILEPQIDFTASQVRSLKEFFEEFFDVPPESSEAKALGRETAAAFQKRLNDLSLLVEKTSHYPFQKALYPVLERFKEVTGKPYTWYLTELMRQKETLLDLKEDIIDPIRQFMSGPQKNSYENAIKFIQTHEPNFEYIEGDETSQLKSILNDPECFRANRIKQIKTLVDELQPKVTSQINKEISKAIDSSNSLKSRLQAMSEFLALKPEQQEKILEQFEVLIHKFEHQRLIAVIRDTFRRFEEEEYSRLLAQMFDRANQKKEITADITENSDNKSKPQIDKTQIEYINSRSVKISFDKAWLADESDVDKYLVAMRTALLKEIHEGKRIQI